MWTALASAALAIVAVVVLLRRGPDRADTIITVAAAVVPVGVTVVSAVGRAPGWAPPGWGVSLLPILIELAALTVLTVRFAHRGRPAPAVLGAGATSLASALIVLRLTSPPSWLAAVGACGLWAGGAA